MNQYETPENAAQFEANNGEFLAQDLLEIDGHLDVARRFPQVVAKLPNIPASRRDSAKKSKSARRQVARKGALLLLVFAVGVGVGSLKPGAKNETAKRAPNAESATAADNAIDLPTETVRNKRDARREGAAEFVASTNFINDDYGRLPGDGRNALYPDLDSHAFPSNSFDGGDADSSSSYRPNNPFAFDYGTTPNVERTLEDSSRVNDAGFAFHTFDRFDQDYPTWDDLEFPAENPNVPAIPQNEYATSRPTDVPIENDAFQRPNQVVGQGFQDFVGQGFQDFQPYGQTNEVETETSLATPTVAPQAPRQDEYNAYADKTKFIGYKTQSSQDFLANNANYAGQDSRNDYNSNVGQFNASGAGSVDAVETRNQVNVAESYNRAAAEYVARGDVELERQSVPSNQINSAPAPSRSLRW